MKSEERLAVYSRLINNMTPKQIAEELEISYPKVLKYRAEYKEALDNNNLGSLLNADKMMVERVAQELKKDLEVLSPFSDQTNNLVPDEPIEIFEPLPDDILTDIDDVVNGIDSYQVLGDKFQNVALNLARQINTYAHNINGPGDLVLLVDALAKLQNAFFNRNMVNVNVLNQMGGGSETGITKFASLKKL